MELNLVETDSSPKKHRNIREVTSTYRREFFLNGSKKVDGPPPLKRILFPQTE
jgi:hypothetical protein